ncbi:MAG: ATPase [Flavobacteriales bacterium]|nr:MAG: ATPase [Flavobacteriales bacterium]
MIKRSIYKRLLNWKKDSKRKPLIVQGARQVGKTHIINEFGKSAYKNFIYLNFEQDVNLHPFFEGQLLPYKIIENLSIYFGKKIEATDTLIFFDEIQVLPEVITSLKYFNEQAPEFHIISAGSLLGVSVSAHKSFPVGKVNFLNMYPLSFMEYLTAIGEELLVEKIRETINFESLNEVFHQQLIEHIKMYFFLGGMPEVVQDYIDHKDIESVRKIQNEILEAYQRDFSKYNDKIQAIKCREVWNSIPYQLAKENKKFKYSDVKSKARAATFELTIEWLKNAGLVNVVKNISTPKLPLSGYANNSKFKLYLFDMGLLGAMLTIPSEIILNPSQLFTEYNGAFIENFVAQELVVYREQALFYWTSKSDAEVDYILQLENEIFPLEVKSGLSRNLKSLRSYESKYVPKLIYRTSPRNFVQSDSFVNIPLYALVLFCK